MLAKEFWSTSFDSGFDSYAFLRDRNIRNQVGTEINNSWYQFVLASSRDLSLIKEVLPIVPSPSALSQVQVNLGGNISVTMKIKNVSQLTITTITDLSLDYVPDSAYLVKEDGAKIKIPDDSAEASEPFVISLTPQEAESFQNYMGSFGFSGGFGIGGGGNFRSSNISCELKEFKDEGGNVMSVEYDCHKI